MSITFFAPGTPVAKGSHRAFPYQKGDGTLGVHVTDTAKGLGDWTPTVMQMARVHMDALAAYPLSDGVGVHLRFFLPRPKRQVRALPTVRPDLDKLVRAVLDALTQAGVWNDDGQVTTLIASKAYTSEYHSTPGVEVSVWPSGSEQRTLPSTATR